MDYLKGLNEKQLEAVSDTEGYVRVIAGAGSGKTKLLVCRYAYLVKEYGIDPSNILCVTFTNKAASEMRRRIRTIIGDENETSLVCTYHGFCARLLREDADKLFLPKGFQIIDTTQQKTILGEIYQKRELRLDYASFEKVLKQIEEYKTLNYTEYVPRMCNPAAGQICKSIATMDDEIMEEYMQRQKAISALDFNDLLSFALYLLENDASVRDKWQDRLNYIQVDEFQDSSARELRLVDILSSRYGNLMIVGDPDQNIYEWRGSDVKLLVDFDKTHVPTKTVFLNRNYRSTPQILTCANTLIDKNTLRLKKDLYTKAPDGAAVIHYHTKCEEDETWIIANLINRDVRSEERQYSDFAILYRSGFLSRVVEKRLVEQNIPYEIYGGVKFYQRMEIQDVIAYLRLIAFRDDSSFKRIINKPRRRFGRTKMAELELAQERDISLFGEGEKPYLLDVLGAHLHEAPFKNSDAAGFVKWVEEMRASIGQLRITEIVNRTTTETGYEKYIRELGDEERYENLMEFKRMADEFERNYGEEMTLPEFLQQIALQAGEDAGKERDAVKLMTIHAAKGLEFPAVIVMGFTEGIFPSARTIEERKLLGLEEERRLCYVAITRAEKQLYLTDSEGTSQNGIKKLPSRFLREIGTDNYVRVGNISKELDQESCDYTRKLNAGISAEEPPDYGGGDVVTHHVFGTGRVISTDPGRRTVKVQFDNLSTPRSLSIDYFKGLHQRMLVKTPAAVSKGNRDNPPEGFFSQTERPSQQLPNPEDGMAAIVLSGEDPNLRQKESAEMEDDERDKSEEPDAPDGGVLLKASGTVTVQENEFENDSPISQDEIHSADNLWKREDVPHSGWACTGVSDLGCPCKTCEMCGRQIIRYVHHMVHPHFHALGVGCVCAGKMEGDIDAARNRERDLKNRQSRLDSFILRQWKQSRNGNPYLKIGGHLIVLYKLQNGGWKYLIDGQFCETRYESREDAATAAFHALEQLQGRP